MGLKSGKNPTKIGENLDFWGKKISIILLKNATFCQNKSQFLGGINRIFEGKK